MASNNFSHSGKIVSIGRDSVQVGFQSQGACAGCQARAKCGMVDSSTRVVDVVVGVDHTYTLGEDVEVAISYQMGVISVVVAYIIPLILLVGILAAAVSLKIGEGLSAVISLAIVALYFVVVYFFRNKLDKQIKFTIVK
ncbi:MAG: SoxR reducing system RseC family protein [Rikenellaceae bacterium]